jgi:hypothetical protein
MTTTTTRTTSTTRTNSPHPLARAARVPPLRISPFLLLLPALVASCAPAAPARNATPRATHAGPLVDFVPAAGLRWLVMARLSELAHDPELKPSIELLFPAPRLAGFAIATGIDLREVPAGLAAGFDYATLYAAETSGDNALVERRFTDRLALGAIVQSSHPRVRRISGTLGRTPETLVSIDQRLVAIAVGDPTPARVVELYALERLPRSPPALRGSALSTLPKDLETAPLRFYAPGPFAGEWEAAAGGLLGAALALGVAMWPEGDVIRCRAVLSGAFRAEDLPRVLSTWEGLSHSTMGRLLSLDHPAAEPQVRVDGDRLVFEVQLARQPLVSGLRAAVVADVWEILRIDGASKNRGALPTTGARSPVKNETRPP